jgi:predicted AAA+ superfamily ATPase
MAEKQYLKREIDEYLISWKNDSDRLPLIIGGARQIGKTESIEHFAYENYKSVVIINFVEEPKYMAIAADGYSADDIIKDISRIDPGKKFIPGETLIFFDEIQENPDITTSLKFFKIDGRFDVICSGSLLGIHYKKIRSHSVGYRTTYDMKSMSFREFLWAKGYDDSVSSEILQHMTGQVPFSEVFLKVYQDLFIDYCTLGGMPAVVSGYIQKGTFEGSLSLQQQLIIDYEADIRKYAESLDQAKVINVYRSIPVQLAKENKKFQYTKIARDARSRNYAGCIDWLSDAGIINICYCLNTPDLPLKGNYNEDKFKIYFGDTGLLVASLDEESAEDLRANRNLNVYKGALFENIAGEALVKQGYSLYYYSKENSTLEEDFFVRTASNLVPVEIKATNNKAKSLRTLIDSKAYPDITYGIKFVTGNIGFENGVYTFPHFCMYMLKDFLKNL